MNKFYYLIFIACIILGCENEDTVNVSSDESITSIYIDGLKITTGDSKSVGCSITGPSVLTPGTTVLYTFRWNRSNGATFTLNRQGSESFLAFGNTVDSGPDFITTEVIVKPGFTCGTVSLITEGCSDEIKLGTADSCDCTPPEPAAIYSQFGSPVPDGYITGNLGQNYICTTTINNQLSVPFKECYTYSWSISPEGNNTAIIYPTQNNAVVIIKKPGTYKILLETNNDVGKRFEQFILIAENCQGLGF